MKTAIILLIVAVSITKQQVAAYGPGTGTDNCIDATASNGNRFVWLGGESANAHAYSGSDAAICVPAADLPNRCVTHGTGSNKHNECGATKSCLGSTATTLGYCYTNTEIVKKCLADSTCTTSGETCRGATAITNVALTASAATDLLGTCRSADTKCYYNSDCTAATHICTGSSFGSTPVEGNCQTFAAQDKWAHCSTQNPCPTHTSNPTKNCINNVCGKTSETCTVANQSTDCGSGKKCFVKTGNVNGVCGTDQTNCIDNNGCNNVANKTAKTTKCNIVTSSSFTSYATAKTGTCVKETTTPSKSSNGNILSVVVLVVLAFIF